MQGIEGDFRIKPSEIDLGGWAPLLATFGYGEVEHVAATHIAYCQMHGDRWLALDEEQYLGLCEILLRGYHFLDDEEDQPFSPPTRENAGEYFLLNSSYLVRGDDGKYRVTEKFIQQCYDKHPKRP